MELVKSRANWPGPGNHRPRPIWTGRPGHRAGRSARRIIRYARGDEGAAGDDRDGGGRGGDQAGGEVARRADGGRSARRPAEARGRGRAPLRPLAGRDRLPDASPGHAPDVVSEQTRRVQEQFGAIAAAYVTSPGHAAGEDLDRLVAWGRALAPARVLDVATGGGHTALALAGVARHVTAYDVTEPMLRAARGLLRERGAAAALVAGDVEALPFQDGAFDLVTCRIAAHHFASVPAAVREVRRVLRPGGSFLLQDILGHDDAEAAAFVTEVERRRDPSHVRAYRAAEWKAFLRASGLTTMDSAIVSKS